MKDHSSMKSFGNFINHIKTLDVEKCERHLMLQSKLIDLNNIDYIGRFESINDDYIHICKTIGIKDYALESRNKSHNRKDYQYYYDDRLAEDVYKIYEKDIRLFNYAF